MNTVTLNLNSVIQLTDEQFFELCRANPDVKFERNANGELIIMPPTGGETGRRNAKLTACFVNWSEQTQLGEIFDSSTCFKLPNGADRSPDVAWVQQDRWDALTPQQKEVFPPIAPDFVLELMSPSDRPTVAQTKMQEYIDSGVRLGWLIDRQSRSVEIYRVGRSPETLSSPATLSGEDVLHGFVLEMEMVW